MSKLKYPRSLIEMVKQTVGTRNARLTGIPFCRLGKSGLKVSRVILGAMSFGSPSNVMGWTLPEAQALPILKHAFDVGINTWDTVLSKSFLNYLS
jgi:hypothetical protein